jgi:hypothetical protein
MIVKSVGVLSIGKVLGCLYALMGLIVGGLFSLFSLAGAAAAVRNAGLAGLGALLFGVGAIVILPVFYGVVGFIGESPQRGCTMLWPLSSGVSRSS